MASSLNNILSVRCLLHFSLRHNQTPEDGLGYVKYCSSWYLLTLSLKRVRRILSSLDFGILHVGLLDALVSFDCERKPLGLQSLVIVSCNFCLTNAESFIGELIRLLTAHFCRWLPTEVRLKSILHCSYRIRFVTKEHTLCFLHFRDHFSQLRC